MRCAAIACLLHVVSVGASSCESFERVEGADVQGHDMDRSGDDLEGCKRLCSTTVECAGFTFPGCQLKSDVTHRVGPEQYMTWTRYKEVYIKRAPPPPCEDDDAAVKAWSKGWSPSCAAAANHCTDFEIGSVVRLHCPVTCGACATSQLEAKGGAPSAKVLVSEVKAMKDAAAEMSAKMQPDIKVDEIMRAEWQWNEHELVLRAHVAFADFPEVIASMSLMMGNDTLVVVPHHRHSIGEGGSFVADWHGSPFSSGSVIVIRRNVLNLPHGLAHRLGSEALRVSLMLKGHTTSQPGVAIRVQSISLRIGSACVEFWPWDWFRPDVLCIDRTTCTALMPVAPTPTATELSSAVLYLAQVRGGAKGQIRAANLVFGLTSSLTSVANCKAFHSPPAVVVLHTARHDGDSPTELLGWMAAIRNEHPSLPIVFVDVSAEFIAPPSGIADDENFAVRCKHDVENRIWSLEYRRMCHFFHIKVFELPVLRSARYVMRLDTDLTLQCRHDMVDPFSSMATGGFVYSTLGAAREPGEVTVGWQSFLRDYYSKLKLDPVSAEQEVQNSKLEAELLDEGLPSPTFSVRIWEIYDLHFFRRKDVMGFLRSAANSGGNYHYRWGDTITRFAAVMLHAPASAVACWWPIDGIGILHAGNDFEGGCGQPRSQLLPKQLLQRGFSNPRGQ